MRRRRGMGDTASINLFEQGLRQYKNLLIELYRKKTLLISQRETFRFQYMSGLKAKFESISGDIYSRLHQLNDPDLTTATSLILSAARSSIPMANLNGQREDGYGALPFSIGGRFRLSMLAPIKQIISEPFMEPEDPDRRPAYKMYNFDIDVARDFTGYWLIWPGNMQTMPPSRAWFEAYVDEKKGDDPGIKAKFDQALELLNADWQSGNFINTMSDMKTVLEKIISKTKEIVRVQHQIDDNELALAQFITEYQEFAGSSNNLSDVLMSIQYEAENAEVIPAVEAPTGSIIVTAAPDAALETSDVVETPIEPMMTFEPEVKETSPLLYVAGAAVLMFLFKGK